MAAVLDAFGGRVHEGLSGAGMHRQVRIRLSSLYKDEVVGLQLAQRRLEH